MRTRQWIIGIAQVASIWLRDFIRKPATHLIPIIQFYLGEPILYIIRIEQKTVQKKSNATSFTNQQSF
ncbi:MAG: hypothetical protein DI535_17090 [Citrobacter freundii]|nr:MAG: hypothetical protein DI535_17090 [Citrobacter freundii]